MKNKPSYLTDCEDAITALLKDVKEGQIVYYEIEQFPSGILSQSLADKCTSAVVAVSGDNTSDYIAILPQRVDRVPNSNTKVYDSDPIIFAMNSADSSIYPTGVFVHHSSYDGRTQPISGFDSFTYEQTVISLRASLITDVRPLSSADPTLVGAFTHGISQFDKFLGESFLDWSSESEIVEDFEKRDESPEGRNPET